MILDEIPKNAGPMSVGGGGSPSAEVRRAGSMGVFPRGYLTLILSTMAAFEPILPVTVKLPALEICNPGRVSTPAFVEAIFPSDVDVAPLAKVKENEVDAFTLERVTR